MSDLSRRQFLTMLAAATATTALPACAAPRTPQQPQPSPIPPTGLSRTTGKRPNILLIITDQERFDLHRPAGFTLPAHERLMAKGVTFRNYHVTTAPCTPSRATLFTGQHVPLTRMFDNLLLPYVKDMPSTIPTLGHMLRSAGYFTAYKGKWHVSRTNPEEEPQQLTDKYADALEPFGFADYNPSGDFHGIAWTGFKHDQEIADGTIGWLKTKGVEIGRQRPWFLASCFVNPHDIMFADTDRPGENVQDNVGPFEIKGPPDTDLYRKEWQVDLPKSFKDDLSKKPSAQRDWVAFNNMFFGDMPFDRTDMWLKHANYYLNCLRDVDGHVNQVLDALEASGQADNTIVIFTADHGEMGGAHGLRQKGPLIYKENIRVPLIIRHPDLTGGVSTDALASAVDLVPTILGFAGVDAGTRKTELPQLKGFDLSETVASPGQAGERAEKAGGLLVTYDALNSVDPDFTKNISRLQEERLKGLDFGLTPALRPDFRRKGFMRGIYDGRYKLARYFAPTGYNRPKTLEALFKDNEVELYDTKADPEEMNNLAAAKESQGKLLVALNSKLEALIDQEIGNDQILDLPPLPQLRPRRIPR